MAANFTEQEKESDATLTRMAKYMVENSLSNPPPELETARSRLDNLFMNANGIKDPAQNAVARFTPSKYSGMIKLDIVEMEEADFNRLVGFLSEKSGGKYSPSVNPDLYIASKTLRQNSDYADEFKGLNDRTTVKARSIEVPVSVLQDALPGMVNYTKMMQANPQTKVPTYVPPAKPVAVGVTSGTPEPANTLQKQWEEAYSNNGYIANFSLEDLKSRKGAHWSTPEGQAVEAARKLYEADPKHAGKSFNLDTLTQEDLDAIKAYSVASMEAILKEIEAAKAKPASVGVTSTPAGAGVGVTAEPDEQRGPVGVAAAPAERPVKVLSLAGFSVDDLKEIDQALTAHLTQDNSMLEYQYNDIIQSMLMTHPETMDFIKDQRARGTNAPEYLKAIQAKAQELIKAQDPNYKTSQVTPAQQAVGIEGIKVTSNVSVDWDKDKPTVTQLTKAGEEVRIAGPGAASHFGASVAGLVTPPGVTPAPQIADAPTIETSRPVILSMG